MAPKLVCPKVNECLRARSQPAFASLPVAIAPVLSRLVRRKGISGKGVPGRALSLGVSRAALKTFE